MNFFCKDVDRFVHVHEKTINSITNDVVAGWDADGIGSCVKEEGKKRNKEKKKKRKKEKKEKKKKRKSQGRRSGKHIGQRKKHWSKKKSKP